MIDSSRIMEIYAEAVGYTLYADYGEAEEALRRGNGIEYPVCGVFRLQPATLTAIRSPIIGIASASIEIIAPMHMHDEVKARLDAAAEALNGTSCELSDDEDAETVYSVSFNVQTCTAQQRSDIGAWCGECSVLSQSLSFVFVEAGVSAYSVRLRIDGMDVPLLTLSETKVHTTSVYSDSHAVGYTASEQEAYGIDFTSPYTKSDVGALFRRAVNGRTGNEAHCVEIEKNGSSDIYLMSISAASDTVQPPSNIGFNISLTELSVPAGHFNGYWRRYVHSAPFITLAVLDEKLPRIDGTERIVFWGDGSADRIDEGFAGYHAYSDGMEVHDVLCFSCAKTRLYREIRLGEELCGKELRIGVDRTAADADASEEERYLLWAYQYTDPIDFDAPDGVPDQASVIFGICDEDDNYKDTVYYADSEKRAFVSDGMRIYFDLGAENVYVDTVTDGRKGYIYDGQRVICPISGRINYIDKFNMDRCGLRVEIALDDVCEDTVE